jgi:hypothetical protein
LTGQPDVLVIVIWIKVGKVGRQIAHHHVAFAHEVSHNVPVTVAIQAGLKDDNDFVETLNLMLRRLLAMQVPQRLWVIQLTTGLITNGWASPARAWSISSSPRSWAVSTRR